MKLKQRAVYDYNPHTATVQLANGLKSGVNLKEFKVLFWDLILWMGYFTRTRIHCEKLNEIAAVFYLIL